MTFYINFIFSDVYNTDVREKTNFECETVIECLAFLEFKFQKFMTNQKGLTSLEAVLAFPDGTKRTYSAIFNPKK